jgi:hypothetical protein
MVIAEDQSDGQIDDQLERASDAIAQIFDFVVDDNPLLLVLKIIFIVSMTCICLITMVVYRLTVKLLASLVRMTNEMHSIKISLDQLVRVNNINQGVNDER